MNEPTVDDWKEWASWLKPANIRPGILEVSEEFGFSTAWVVVPWLLAGIAVAWKLIWSLVSADFQPGLLVLMAIVYVAPVALMRAAVMSRGALVTDDDFGHYLRVTGRSSEAGRPTNREYQNALAEHYKRDVVTQQDRGLAPAPIQQPEAEYTFGARLVLGIATLVFVPSFLLLLFELGTWLLELHFRYDAVCCGEMLDPLLSRLDGKFQVVGLPMWLVVLTTSVPAFVAEVLSWIAKKAGAVPDEMQFSSGERKRG